MTTLQPFELSLLAAIVLLGLELLTGTFIFLSFCVGLVVVALVQAFTGRFTLGRDALVFSAITIGTMILMRSVFGAAGDTKRSHKDVNDY